MAESYVVMLKENDDMRQTYIMTRDEESLKLIDAKKMLSRYGWEWYVNDKPLVVIDWFINRGFRVVAMTCHTRDKTLVWTLHK